MHEATAWHGPWPAPRVSGITPGSGKGRSPARFLKQAKAGAMTRRVDQDIKSTESKNIGSDKNFEG